MFDLKDKQILIVGGGDVALRRVKKLLEYDVLPNQVTCVAPSICKELLQLSITVREEVYHPDMVKGQGLVIAATDDKMLNLQIKQDCKSQGIFCNVVSDKEASDFIFPASFSRGGLTFSVCTDGASPHLSKHIIQSLQKQYEESWAQKVFLLEAIRKEILKGKPKGASTLSREDADLLKQSIYLEIHELEELLKTLKDRDKEARACKLK
jgi:precorrin-2 dehydrogenase/sirohydrochlorin ferrochelatase